MKQQTSRDAKAISKDRIVSLIDELIGQYDVLAPVREDGVVRFDQITSGDQALLNFANAKLSPKDVFFPASEVMFAYEGTRVEVPSLGAKRVLFGVRPCDARSFVLLEKVFSAPDYPDVYYLEKRENTYVVGMGCNRPLRTCFCTSVGGGPFNDEGLDVLLSDTGDKYLVEAVSDRGRELLARADWGSAAESDLGQKEQIVRQAEARATSGAVADFAELSQAEDLQEKLRLVYEDSLWDELSQKCLGCAVCAYVCPTCHCFDVVDEGMNDRGRRVRIWDCCQFPLFTLHASGHNPRPSGRERTRQRIMHKFRYFLANFGEIGCVGCGRCIVNCPVNVDLRKVLNRIVEQRGPQDV